MKPKSFFLLNISLALSAAGWLFTACSDSEQIHSQKLGKAIDLFYLENKNDSVLQLLDELPAEKLSFSEIQLAAIFRAAAVCEAGKPDSAMTVLKQIEPGKLHKDTRYYYESILGLIEFRQFLSEKAYNTLVTLTNKETPDIRAEALAQRTIGRIMISYGEDKSAIDWLMRSRQNFEKAGLEKSVAINDKFLGNISIRLNVYREALPYLNAAISTLKKYNDGAELFYAYVVMIEYFIRQNQPDSARYYTQKAQQSFDVKRDKTMQALLYNNRGEIEKMNGNYEGAIEMFDSTLLLGTDYYYSSVRRQTAYLNLAEVYNKMKLPDMARKNALDALNTVEVNQKYNIRYAVYYQLAKSYAPADVTRIQEYMDSAIYCLQKYHASQSVDLINFFDTQQELHLSQHKIEELKSKAVKIRLNYLISGFFLLAVITALTVLFHIQKDRNRALRMLVHKNLKLLEKEVDEERLARQKRSNTSKRKCQTENDEEKLQTIYDCFIHWLYDEGNYMRNDISLSVASKELNTNREYLSRAINEHNKHFNDLVNNYRVKEIIRIFSNPGDDRNKLTLQVLASEVGFNSNSVFIDAFRKVTGMTPTQFREHLNENQPKPKG